MSWMVRPQAADRECGPRFTGLTSGVIVTRPACVTFEVSSPSARAATVTVAISPATC